MFVNFRFASVYENGAEVNTHETLHYMKRGFVEQGIIQIMNFILCRMFYEESAWKK